MHATINMEGYLTAVLLGGAALTLPRSSRRPTAARQAQIHSLSLLTLWALLVCSVATVTWALALQEVLSVFWGLGLLSCTLGTLGLSLKQAATVPLGLAGGGSGLGAAVGASTVLWGQLQSTPDALAALPYRTHSEIILWGDVLLGLTGVVISAALLRRSWAQSARRRTTHHCPSRSTNR